MNRYIALDGEKRVTGVRLGKVIVDGEIESKTGELGQIMQEDGTFITPEPEPIEPQPTLEERIETLQQDNLILMDALATVFEEVLMLREEIGGTIA